MPTQVNELGDEDVSRQGRILAPLALFIYNRPLHVERVLVALAACPEYRQSPLYIFCDGPKSSRDSAAVQQARGAAARLASMRDGVTVIERRKNIGLAASVIDGVNTLCEKHGHVIVIEDDLVVSPQFLTYMNAALQRYEAQEAVMQVSGHMFPAPGVKEPFVAAFMPFPTSWGWGTWLRAWRRFDPNASGWEALMNDRVLRRRFNLDGAYDYYGMLKKQMTGKIDSWAIRWYWSMFCAGGLALYPPRSLVQNIGFDGSGTHGGAYERKLAGRGDKSGSQMQIEWPVIVATNEDILSAVKRQFGSVRRNAVSAILRRLLRGVWR